MVKNSFSRYALARPLAALRVRFAQATRRLRRGRIRGVCSRIPHLRPFRRDSHGQLSTHVYILHIIPFMGCLRLSAVVVSIDSHSENPRFPIPFVDTHSFVPTALTPHPANTGLSGKSDYYLLYRTLPVSNTNSQYPSVNALHILRFSKRSKSLIPARSAA